jgi:hypothetical protein
MDLCILLIQVVGLIHRRTCSGIQLYLEMDLGRLEPVQVTSEEADYGAEIPQGKEVMIVGGKYERD